jgi:hypothetical protein
VHARAQLGWTHFRQFMSVPEAKSRARLEKAAGAKQSYQGCVVRFWRISNDVIRYL